jgi:hypothetical protein
MSEACSMHDKIEKCVKILIGKLERQRPLRRTKRGWEDYIKMVLNAPPMVSPPYRGGGV